MFALVSQSTKGALTQRLSAAADPLLYLIEAG